MALETLRPNAAGDSSAHIAVGDSPNYACVDEASADDETTYVKLDASTGSSDDLYNLPASAIGAGDTINSVTLKVRARRNVVGPSTINFLWRENSTTTAGGTMSLTGSYGDFSEVKTVRPSDSAAWTLTDLNALQVGIRGSTGALHHYRVTQVYVEVDYTVAGVSKFLTLLGVGQ